MKQRPFTKAQATALLKAHKVAHKMGGNSDAQPIVKFFCPWGAATWLISEWDGQDTMFGLCDMGHGCVELGYVSLSELRSIRGPFGLTIERDLYFTPNRTMEEYAEVGREKGRIIA